MSKPKLQVNEVFVVEKIYPYEGSEILAITVSLETAKSHAAPKHWRHVTYGDGTSIWTTEPEHSRDITADYLFITQHRVQP